MCSSRAPCRCSIALRSACIFTAMHWSRANSPKLVIRAPLRANRPRTLSPPHFQSASITGLLIALSNDTRFTTIDTVRNLVGHRISGRRSVRASSTMQKDGTYTHWREETWHLPGAAGTLAFDEEMLQRHLDDVTALLASLASAAREFAEAEKTARKP